MHNFETLASLEGQDIITKSLSETLGKGVVRKVMDARTAAVSDARVATKLFVAPGVGLSLNSSAGAVEVPRNTNYGDLPS